MTVTDVTFERGLPASLDAERALLGCILLENSLFYEAAQQIAARDFMLDPHRRLFRAMGGMLSADRSLDIVTLAEELARSREIDAVGGVAYLASLTEGLPRRLSVDDYVRIIRDKSQLRRLIAVSSEAATRAADQAEEASSIIGFLQNGIQSVLDDGEAADEPLVAAYSVAALNQFLAETKLERSPGLSYGLGALNDFTGGMRPGEVTVVGARSGVGKSSLMCQAAAANCAAGVPTHLFSLEMSREQILRRLWAIVSGVPFVKIRDPWKSSIDDREAVMTAADLVSSWPLRIHDKSELHIDQIVAFARLSIQKHGSRLIVVDYAQTVNADGRDERAKVSSVSSRMTKTVKGTPAALMMLSQLRKVDREFYSKPPTVGDLRETGQLENDAHVIALLHRGWDEETSRISDKAEVIIPKQRSGETGAIEAAFNRRSVTFEDVEKENG